MIPHTLISSGGGPVCTRASPPGEELKHGAITPPERTSYTPAPTLLLHPLPCAPHNPRLKPLVFHRSSAAPLR